jgi:hypothetical protein
MKSSPLKIVPGQEYAILITGCDWVEDRQYGVISCIDTTPELDWDVDPSCGDVILIKGNYQGREGAIIKVKRVEADKDVQIWEEVE